MHYQNKQIGTALLGLMGGVSLFITLMAIDQNNQVLWLTLPILGLITFLFHSLNIEVSAGEVRWSFGPVFWKKAIKIESIQQINPITLKWYYGLGIRYIGSGWLYTVSGTSAIQITLKDGSKINLGTNDLNNLMNAIRSQLTLIK